MNKLLLLPVLIALACSDNRKQDGQIVVEEHRPDSLAVIFNDQAVGNFEDAQSMGADPSAQSNLYDSALRNIDRAIVQDSLYTSAYGTKARFLLAMDSPVQALEVLRCAEKMKPDFVEGIMGQALIYEKLGKRDEADRKFQQAGEVYDERLRRYPDHQQTLEARAFLHVFTLGKDIALDEFREIQKRYPDNEYINTKIMIIQNFDRAKFIREFGQ